MTIKTRLLAALLATCSLAACQPQAASKQTNANEPSASCISKDKKFVGSDICDEGIGGDFSLSNQDGNTMSLADFKGKVVALSFGYTRCPDVCPTNLLDLAQVMQKLGADADKVQVVFISLDPSRDTPSVLKDYVPLFDERFIGLTAANDEAIAPVLKQWKISATKAPGKDGFYSIDHSAGLYLLDQNGKAKIYLPHGTPPEQITADIKALLS